MSAHEGRSETRARRGVFVGTLAAHLKCFLLLFTINQGQRHRGEALPACLHTHDHIRNRVKHTFDERTHTQGSALHEFIQISKQEEMF